MLKVLVYSIKMSLWGKLFQICGQHSRRKERTIKLIVETFQRSGLVDQTTEKYTSSGR